MKTNTQQARESLQAISQAETAARLNSPNNGTVPLVWGSVILVCMVSYEPDPADLCAGRHRRGRICGLTLVMLLPALPPCQAAEGGQAPDVQRVGDVPRCGADGRHRAGTHFWHTPIRPGAFTLIGLLDSAPLFYVGWIQRRRAQGLHP